MSPNIGTHMTSRDGGKCDPDLGFSNRQCSSKERVRQGPCQSLENTVIHQFTSCFLFVLLFLVFCFQGANPVGNFFIFYRNSEFTVSSLSDPNFRIWSQACVVFIMFCFWFIFYSFWRARRSKQQIIFLWNYLFNFGCEVQPQWEVYHDQRLSDRESLGSQHGKSPHWDLPGTEYTLCGFFISLCLQMFTVQRDRGCS